MQNGGRLASQLVAVVLAGAVVLLSVQNVHQQIQNNSVQPSEEQLRQLYLEIDTAKKREVRSAVSSIGFLTDTLKSKGERAAQDE